MSTLASRLAVAVLATMPVALPATAQNLDSVQVRTIEVADNVYMLMGAGGNIGLSVGADGAFLVDDQYAPMTPKILAAVRALTDEPVRFVLNTHWHDDHTGGNENLGETGALIVAHENVRSRMSVEQFVEAFGQRQRFAAAPASALPVVTFTEAVTFHLNGEEIHAFHVEPAHTDGDAIIRFRNADVVHMGDTYMNGMYPFIDVSSGGSIDGVIAAVERVLGTISPATKVIPGHGELSNRDELRAFHDMLVDVRDRVRAMVQGGSTVEQVQAARPTVAYDAEWGDGFMTPEQFVAIVYSSVAAATPR